MRSFFKLIILFLFISIGLKGQNTEIDGLIARELKMNFPSIYFKHNSLDYAAMPYTVDSCFNYIAQHINDIHDLVIWRDSLETEKISQQRIKKLKAGLSKYKETRKIYIESMRKEQKISRHTIEMGSNTTQIEYLLSLNSVFDIAKTHFITKRKWWQRRTHYEGRYLCFGCWRRGAFTKEYQRIHGSKKQKQ